LTDGPQALRVVTDACVLINFGLVDRLDLLGGLVGFDFLLPEPVLAEIRRPDLQQRLQRALERGQLHLIEFGDFETLSVFAELRRVMGRGEAACLAVAAARGWLVASDERRAFLRTAQQRLGSGRILNTPGLFVLAIRAGLITVAEADDAKRRLEEQRFRMRFSSFRDILQA
jgi:predicted nucleic acid-binding protein